MENGGGFPGSPGNTGIPDNDISELALRRLVE